VPVAMAAGVCVVVSAVPATEGLVHDGEDGLRVEPGDGPDLLRALASVLGDGVERRRLGEAAAGAIRGALRSA
ncbi:MAG: glycosyltransferase, partial [Planctomycetota bacterium]|nr:glycosyltransferase [Planctomycetota bacterium]